MNRFVIAVAASLAAFVAAGCSESPCAGCGDADAGNPNPRMPYTDQTEVPWAACADDQPGEDATQVVAFDKADQYFTGEDNRRVIETEVDFPESGTWGRIDVQIDLTCPAVGQCDHWDRNAALFVVENSGKPNEQATELERFITPYGIGMCVRADVTQFAPLLTGHRTLRSAIDTWVGPGNKTDGNGWRVTVKFIFQPDKTAHGAVEVIPVLAGADVELGDPAKASAAARTVKVPTYASHVQLRVAVTGHGQGNLENCGEFCQLDRSVQVNGQSFASSIWRNDCGKNPNGAKQMGNWKPSRAGWCPGAYVTAQTYDVTDAIKSGNSDQVEIRYAALLRDSEDEYVNTCRPGAGDASNVCEGCVFDSAAGNCDYNGGLHTAPLDRVSITLFVYY